MLRVFRTQSIEARSLSEKVETETLLASASKTPSSSKATEPAGEVVSTARRMDFVSIYSVLIHWPRPRYFSIRRYFLVVFRIAVYLGHGQAFLSEVGFPIVRDECFPKKDAANNPD